METRTVELNVQTNSSDAAAEFKRLHDEIALAQQELDGLTQELGASNTATVAAQKKVNDLRGAYDQLNGCCSKLFSYSTTCGLTSRSRFYAYGSKVNNGSWWCCWWICGC